MPCQQCLFLTHFLSLPLFSSCTGIIFGSRVVLTCGSGVSAAVLALGMDLLGMEFEKAPIYDGSWSEWGDPARADLPKIK